MPKTVQIRDIDDDIYRSIQRHALEEGYSVPEYLKRLIVQAASRPSLSEWIRRTKGRRSDVSRDEILSHLEAIRGPWPDDRH